MNLYDIIIIITEGVKVGNDGIYGQMVELPKGITGITESYDEVSKLTNVNQELIFFVVGFQGNTGVKQKPIQDLLTDT